MNTQPPKNLPEAPVPTLPVPGRAQERRTKCGKPWMRRHHFSLTEDTKSAAQMEQSNEGFSYDFSVFVKIVY